MNLGDIKDEVRERLGEAAAHEDFWKTVHIARMANRAQQRFCHEEQWPWLTSIQSGIAVAAGSNQVELIDDVAFSRHWSLTLIKADGTLVIPQRIPVGEAMHKRRQLGTTQGDPRWYTSLRLVKNAYGDGDEAPAHIVTLYPTPDSAMTAEYYFVREPDPMLADGDEPDMPDAYHDAIVAWTTAKLWEKELRGAETKRMEQLEEYQYVLEQARRDMRQLAKDESLIVGGGNEPDPMNEPFISYRNIPERLGP